MIPEGFSLKRSRSETSLKMRGAVILILIVFGLLFCASETRGQPAPDVSQPVDDDGVGPTGITDTFINLCPKYVLIAMIQYVL